MFSPSEKAKRSIHICELLIRNSQIIYFFPYKNVSTGAKNEATLIYLYNKYMVAQLRNWRESQPIIGGGMNVRLVGKRTRENARDLS